MFQKHTRRSNPEGKAVRAWTTVRATEHVAKQAMHRAERDSASERDSDASQRRAWGDSFFCCERDLHRADESIEVVEGSAAGLDDGEELVLLILAETLTLANGEPTERLQNIALCRCFPCHFGLRRSVRGGGGRHRRRLRLPIQLPVVPRGGRRKSYRNTF